MADVGRVTQANGASLCAGGKQEDPAAVASCRRYTAEPAPDRRFRRKLVRFSIGNARSRLICSTSARSDSLRSAEWRRRSRVFAFLTQRFPEDGQDRAILRSVRGLLASNDVFERRHAKHV